MVIVMGICQSLVRNGLDAVLRQTCPDAALEMAESFAKLEERLLQGNAALLLIDLRLPGLEGMTSLRQLRKTYPTLKILVHTDQEDRRVILECLSAGVNGYANFALSIEQLRHAIELVMAGEIYVPPALAEHSRAVTVGPMHLLTNDDAGLTPRQTAVLNLLRKAAITKSHVRSA